VDITSNPEVYYSQQANMHYMSVSQYKNFMKCEAAALAQIRGEDHPIDRESLTAGQYFHAWNEGTLDIFKVRNHDTIYNKKGDPYAAFKKIDEMIAVLKSAPYCMAFLEGEKEVAITAVFADVPWKIKIDVLNSDYGFFTDLKSTSSIRELNWSERYRQRLNFIEEYDYLVQMAVYAEIERLHSSRDKWLHPIIVAVSKENPPDKAVISLYDEQRIHMELNNIEDNMPRIMAVKNGVELPKRCEVCKYCRSTKIVSEMISYYDLGGVRYAKA